MAWRGGLGLCLSAATQTAWPAAPPLAAAPDHQEFEAQLETVYRVAAGEERTVALHFSYPDGGRRHQLRWRLELLAPDGRPLRHWQGAQPLGTAPLAITLRWRQELPPQPVPGGPAGAYRLQLRASADGDRRAPPATVEQSWDIAVGPPGPPALEPAPVTLAAPASLLALAPQAAPLPYTVYLGNLHSQTNHSDGGGALDDCHGAQPPQSAAFGPADAYAYAQSHGLDFLMTSEHNHMYDGSDGTNPDADPADASALYRSGLQAARDFNDTHPGFVALYGQEWGVISHGGHLNILNSDQLLGWEKNRAGKLIGDSETPRGDYGALYRQMRQRGWTGQFNHPAGDQFLAAGKPLGYTADGDAAMALCEVMNSNAFSIHTDQAEPRRSNYEAICNKALAAGYHIAFSSNQDNHCANWGMSFSNRTGVLIPNGSAFTTASLLEAIQARRVFATMDQDSQLILQANGHIMGERFDNHGPLHLQVSFATRGGRSADSLSIFHGIPGGNGGVSAVSHSANTNLTPAAGPHFYYARLTLDDGKMLWSAPVWVTQQP
jgi:hypothetical protein